MFIKTETVDGIVTDFRKTVGKLRKHAAFHQTLVEERKKAIESLEFQNNTSLAEHNRAHVIANRLEGLIGA